MAIPRDFGFGSEEQMVRDSAVKFLQANASVEKLRGQVGTHEQAYESQTQPVVWDERVWREIVALGWPALTIPEAHGGAAMRFVAATALAEAAGRAALPSPLASTFAATAVLTECPAGGPALERIAGGTSATLAATGADAQADPGAADVKAQATDNGAVLNGQAWFVQDARKSELFVVAAEGDDGIGIYVVARDTPGLTIAPDQIVDLTRDQARVVFDNVEVGAQAIAANAPQGRAALEAALPKLLVLLAADLVGAAEWQLQTTAEYARTRKQFDHEIGFFQAVKHPIVNMMVDIDRARSLTYAAAAAIDHEPATALRAARMAKAAASDAAAFCSDRSVQLHGGIGFTWECDVHLYFKRQKHSQFLLGDGAIQRQKLAEAYGG